MLLITTGFSFGILAEQNNNIEISESRSIGTEVVSCEVFSDDTLDVTPSSYLLDILDQQQLVDSNYAFAVSENGYYAQSFKPTLGWLTRVELKLYKIGNPVGLRISIRSNLTGSDLTSKYLSGGLISTNKTWVEFDFPAISVTPGGTYYIVWDPVGVPDSHNNSYWCVGANNPYANGSAWKFLGLLWEIHNPVETPDPDFCFKTYGLSEANNPPNKPNTPGGDVVGKIGISHTYESSTTDIDGDQIYYFFDWDDGTDSGWLGPYDNGDICQKSHIWNTMGSYSIKVKARDMHGVESVWSDSLPITMPYSYNLMQQLFKLLLQRFHNTFPL